MNLKSRAIVSMLYWGEGYKGSPEKRAQQLDFANSDPSMISVFYRVFVVYMI